MNTLRRHYPLSTIITATFFLLAVFFFGVVGVKYLRGFYGEDSFQYDLAIIVVLIDVIFLIVWPVYSIMFNIYSKLKYVRDEQIAKEKQERSIEETRLLAELRTVDAKVIAEENERRARIRNAWANRATPNKCGNCGAPPGEHEACDYCGSYV